LDIKIKLYIGIIDGGAAWPSLAPALLPRQSNRQSNVLCKQKPLKQIRSLTAMAANRQAIYIIKYRLNTVIFELIYWSLMSKIKDRLKLRSSIDLGGAAKKYTINKLNW